MKRILLAATALLAVSVPASAQYPGWYYERGPGGYYEGQRGPYGGRGYGRYEDADDDYRPRRGRGAPPGYGGPPARHRGAAGNTCVTPRGACRVGVPTPIGTPCGCHAGGTASRGTVQ